MTPDLFKPETAEAMKAYEKFILCLDKTPEQCEASLISLVEKAIKAYENRGPNLRHGIALDKQITIILSQTENERPFVDLLQSVFSISQEKAEPLAVNSAAHIAIAQLMHQLTITPVELRLRTSPSMTSATMFVSL